ncbi:MAG: hypothetical protein IJH17_00610, partial [Clostridia bacterium]|nr:hypothetical protein [Clostridia bacterium]
LPCAAPAGRWITRWAWAPASPTRRRTSISPPSPPPPPAASPLRVYTTTHLTDHKFYTLMHDYVYRLSVAFQNTAYNQCTQTSFYIGPEMDTNIPVPNNDYVNGTPLPDFTEEID